MINKLILFLATALCLSVSRFSYAEVSQYDIADALLAYPRAEIVEQQNASVVDYPVAMGEMKKVRGLWAPDRERRLEGVLQRLTLQIPEGHSPQEAFNFYRQKMIELKARVLYYCEARSCGPSNAWANEMFHVKQLYGLDQQQSYAAFELIDDQGKLQFVSLYTVIRGNKRVYAHTEWLQTTVGRDNITLPSEEEISKVLQIQGAYYVDGLSVVDGKLQIDPTRMQAIVTVILTSRGTKLKIIGRDLSDTDSEGQSGDAVKQQSKSYAQQFLKLLTDSGFPAQRLSAETVGRAEFFNQSDNKQDSFIKIEMTTAN